MAKSRKAIDAKVDRRLEATKPTSLKISRYAQSLSGVSGNGVVWYAVTPQFLFGVAQERDMRASSADDLRRVFQTLTGQGKQHLAFKHPHRQQRVSLSQNLLVKPAQKTALKARLKRSIGRLKAAWCVAFFAGVIKISGSIPKYVTRHAQGARGRFNDGLHNKDAPYFEIANSALGVSKETHYLQKALDIRAKAMVANTELFFQGKKHLSDYAKGAHAFIP
jgi:hypothetical protein